MNPKPNENASCKSIHKIASPFGTLYDVSFSLTDRQKLFLLFCLAALLRLTALCLAGVINRDTVLYLSMADKIANGEFVTGMNYCPDIPPLYPMILSIPIFCGIPGLAGAYMISFITSIVLLLPLYGIATLLFSRKIGLWVLFLAAIHPILLEYSHVLTREPTYICFMICAAYFCVRQYRKDGVWNWIAAGIFSALAYLIRKEGAVILIVMSGWCVVNFFIMSKREAVKKIVGFVIMLAIFFVLCFIFQWIMKDTDTNWRVIDIYKLLKYLKMVRN